MSTTVIHDEKESQTQPYDAHISATLTNWLVVCAKCPALILFLYGFLLLVFAEPKHEIFEKIFNIE